VVGSAWLVGLPDIENWRIGTSLLTALSKELFRLHNVSSCVLEIIEKKEGPMKRPFSFAGILSLGAVFFLCCVQAQAQTVPALEKINSQAELEKTIVTLDTALFAAYNQCDLDKFASFIADDVEFYHDKGGVTLGREALTESIKKNICGRLTRELVPGTLQVYPMKGYGALEIGSHCFHHTGQQAIETAGEAQFIHFTAVTRTSKM
jgi:hypothetical protein